MLQHTDMGDVKRDHCFSLNDQPTPLKAHMFKKSWAPCLLALVSQMPMAQTIPSAGGQLQQIPVVPSATPNSPMLDVVPRAQQDKVKGQGRVFVAHRLNVVGALAYSDSELQKMAGFESGREIGLKGLFAMAEKITQRYRQDGYLLARAYVPAQEITDGVVTIAVLEGRYGQVALNNTSSMNNQVPNQIMQGLKVGDAIERASLEERMLRLSDLPGVEVRSTLVPGASMGLSDLIVEVKPGAAVSGSVDADNAGNRYTGVNRIGATFNWNNPTGQGDVLSLRALTGGPGLQYGRLSYQTLWGPGRVGLAFSELRYELGHEFKALDASGRARIATLFGSYPLIRSRSQNLNLGLSLDAKDFDDRLDAIPLRTEKNAQVATATLSGDHRDAWGGGGLNDYSLAWSTGHLDIRSPAAWVRDTETAQTNGHFNKLAVAVSRTQRTTETVVILASLNAQMASKNLDVSEKMSMGGMHGVRAYPEGESYADEGVLLTLEVRKQLNFLQTKSGQIHGVVFLDAGTVKLNHSPWAAGVNHRHLSGAGVGVYWTRDRDYSVKAFYARKMGREDALSAPDKSGRFWVQAVKYF